MIKPFLTTEERLNEAQTIAKMGSWYYDFKEDKVYWTDGMFKIFGINKKNGEPSIEDQHKGIHPEDAGLWIKSVLALKENATELNISFKAYRVDDKKLVHVEMTGKPIFDKKIVAIHGTCQDITQRVLSDKETAREQAKLIQSSKLSMLSEMAGGMAHELNNPLAIISGYSHWLESQFAKKANIDNDEELDIVKKINDSVNRMTEIIKSLRTFSRNASEDAFRSRV